MGFPSPIRGKIFLLFLVHCWSTLAGSPLRPNAPDTLDNGTFDFASEIREVRLRYEKLELPLWQRAYQLDSLIADTPPGKFRKWTRFWLERQEVECKIQSLEEEKEMQLLKIRYKKGIDLIKLLYEKILALDHHFSGMQIYQNILLLSNPNTYPDFQKARELLEEQLKKKNSVQLPPVLHTNPYLSAAYSLVTAFIGEGDPKERQKEFEQISCILDFTVRMGSELSIIQHETEYLKTANHSLKMECERLFEDYVKVVGYLVPLEKCRINDDWEKVYLQLDDFVLELDQDPDPDPQNRWMREQVNLEFATQRVADFIGRYQLFVTQGTQYYQKFENIISGYENEEACKQKLPRQFEELRRDIKGTIEKFSNTYNLPEIQGSRMKDLLFGIAE